MVTYSSAGALPEKVRKCFKVLFVQDIPAANLALFEFFGAKFCLQVK